MTRTILIDGKPYVPDPNRPKFLRLDPDYEAAQGETYDVWLYFVLCDTTRRIKIGVANNPMSRFRSIQCGSPTELRIVGLIWGPRTNEKKLHRKFREHRVRGEWFDAAPDLIAYIEENGRITPEIKETMYAMAACR